ncbi:bacteriocin-like protein [Elizabethkingia anophelis]
MKTLKKLSRADLKSVEEALCWNLVQVAVMYAAGKELTIVVLP